MGANLHYGSRAGVADNCARMRPQRIAGVPSAMFCNSAIDWGATGSWAQFVAGALAVIAAVIISRSELRAQRKVAEEAQLDFGRMINGLCEMAVADILFAANRLDTPDDVRAMAAGIYPVPSTARHAKVLASLDINRMPSAWGALAVVDMERLCERGDTFAQSALESWREHGAIHPDLMDALEAWRRDAMSALASVRTGVPPGTR